MTPEILAVGIAEGKIARGEAGLATYALGSCVGICLHDPQRQIAGLVHVMLPCRELAFEKNNPYKFADSGLAALLHVMLQAGALHAGITAKIAGGAQMFPPLPGQAGVGQKNIAAVRNALRRHGIRLLAEDVGGTQARTLLFCARTGLVRVKTVRAKEHIL